MIEEPYRNAKLDGLRGLAAAAVVVHHAINIGNLSLVERVMTPPLSSVVGAQDRISRFFISVFSGGSAVTIFFVLSAAVLSASLLRDQPFRATSALRFVIRRVMRIYPAMIAAVLAFGAFSHLSLPAGSNDPFTFGQVVLNCLLVQREVMAATWTLQVEMLMIPLILLAIWLRRLYGTLPLVGFVIFGMICIFQGSPFDLSILNAALLAFALGMLVPTQMTRDAAAVLPLRVWLAFIVLAIGVRFVAPFTPTAGLIFDVTLAFGTVAVLYYAEGGVFILDHRATRFLGRISYSLYLWHVVVTREIFPFYRSAIGAGRFEQNYLLFGLGFSVIVLAIAIPLATVAEAYIERPFIKMGTRLTRQ